MSGREALRQQQLLAALARRADGPALRESGARAQRGLAAYRANAGALAERALAAAVPTVLAMLGEEAFAGFARAHALAHPPLRGDLGEWGGELPGWIEAQPGLAEWPWLADAARLDLALHACERAADATLDAASLARLGDADPAVITIELLPGTRVLESTFPIATIHAAHRSGAADGFAPVRAALAAGRGEAVCVSRAGWRAVVHTLAPGEAGFMQALLAGGSLAQALQCAGEAFDFGAWLQRAISLSWLKGVALRHDPGASHHDGSTT